MKKNIYLFAGLFIIGSLLFTTSCKKNKLNKQTTTSEDNALAEDLFDDVFKNIDEAADEESLDGTNKQGYKIDYTFGSGCATVTLVPAAWDTTQSPPVWNATFPKTLTIDFGSTNCKGNDGKYRRGKITAVFTGKYREAGTVITTTLSNYHVNDYSVEGTKTVTNNSGTSFTINVNGSVASPDGSQSVSWTSTRTRTWVKGYNTGFWTPNSDSTGYLGFSGILDDAYSITGSASGVNREGRKFDVTITTALYVEFCGWIPEITKGVVEIQPEKLKLRTVDFGDGSCDRTYTVTIKKKTYTKTY